jgi:hypothetical protein
MTRQKVLALTSAALLAASSTIAFAQGTGGGTGGTGTGGAAGATSSGGAEGPGGTTGSNATSGPSGSSGAQGGQAGGTGQNNPDCTPGAKNQTTASQQKQRDGKTVC